MNAPTVEEARAEAEAAMKRLDEAVKAKREAAATARAEELAEELAERERRVKGSGDVRVGREALLGVLKVCRSAGRSVLPICQTVRIEASKGVLRMAATDLDTSVELSVPATVKKPFSACLLPRYLLALATAAAPGSEIHLVRSDAKVKVDTTDLIEAELDWWDPLDFPMLNGFKPATRAVFCGSEFRRQIPAVFMATATDDSRPVLTGAYFSGGGWAAVDGFRLVALEMAPTEGELPEAIFPRPLMLRAARYAEDDGQVVVEVNENRTLVRVHAGPVTLTGQLVQGTFPNYRQLIPEDWVSKVTVNAVAFRTTVALLKTWSDSGSGIIRFEASEKGLTLDAQADKTTVSQRMLCPFEGEANKIAFNAAYLRDMVRLFDGDFTLEWASPSSPGVFRPLGRTDLLSVVMPMFVQW